MYLECDELASQEEREISQKMYDQIVSTLDGEKCGDWNHNMSFTLNHERKLIEDAGFETMAVPWTDVDEHGYGKAIFVAKKYRI